ncbi:LOW QUALITY PROTEIN: CD164 sialomucin-like 2 protein [Pelodytes ibericus]
MKLLCYAILFATALLAPCKAEGCMHLRTCERCTEGVSTLNITCKWVTCEGSENSSCVTSGEETDEFCLVSNEISTCEGFLPFLLHYTSLYIPDAPPTNTLSPPVFHTGSFIGGGLLVVLLQAIGYFVLKHLHGPEREYQTM